MGCILKIILLFFYCSKDHRHWDIVCGEKQIWDSIGIWFHFSFIQLSRTAGSSHAWEKNVYSTAVLWPIDMTDRKGFMNQQDFLSNPHTECAASCAPQTNSTRLDTTQTKLNPPTQFLNPAAKHCGLNIGTPGIHIYKTHAWTQTYAPWRGLHQPLGILICGLNAMG